MTSCTVPESEAVDVLAAHLGLIPDPSQRQTVAAHLVEWTRQATLRDLDDPVLDPAAQPFYRMAELSRFSPKEFCHIYVCTCEACAPPVIIEVCREKPTDMVVTITVHE